MPSHWAVKVDFSKEDLVVEGLIGPMLYLLGWFWWSGPKHKGPRIRRCAWSVVVVAAADNGAFEFLGSAVGNLAGTKQ